MNELEFKTMNDIIEAEDARLQEKVQLEAYRACCEKFGDAPYPLYQEAVDQFWVIYLRSN